MKSYSQSSQDKFVVLLLESKREGFYLEIGGNDPININNTYLLESDYNWKGLSVEIDESLVRKYNNIRSNKCYHKNALTVDYKEFLDSCNVPHQIDYLSIDIEPPQNTYACLKMLVNSGRRFSVITFEHEFYYAGPSIREESRQFLRENGYVLIAGNVSNIGYIYEDWYVDPTALQESVWKPIVCDNLDSFDHNLIIKRAQEHMVAKNSDK